MKMRPCVSATSSSYKSDFKKLHEAFLHAISRKFFLFQSSSFFSFLSIFQSYSKPWAGTVWGIPPTHSLYSVITFFPQLQFQACSNAVAEAQGFSVTNTLNMRLPRFSKAFLKFWSSRCKSNNYMYLNGYFLQSQFTTILCWSRWFIGWLFPLHQTLCSKTFAPLVL